jgi:hypothetical protein
MVRKTKFLYARPTPGERGVAIALIVVVIWLAAALARTHSPLRHAPAITYHSGNLAGKEIGR